jgi:hypothetical protein
VHYDIFELIVGFNGQTGALTIVIKNCRGTLLNGVDVDGVAKSSAIKATA